MFVCFLSATKYLGLIKRSHVKWSSVHEHWCSLLNFRSSPWSLCQMFQWFEKLGIFTLGNSSKMYWQLMCGRSQGDLIPKCIEKITWDLKFAIIPLCNTFTAKPISAFLPWIYLMHWIHWHYRFDLCYHVDMKATPSWAPCPSMSVEMAWSPNVTC